MATQVPRRLSLLKISSTRASLVIPAAHWAETTTVPAVGEVLRRDRRGNPEAVVYVVAEAEPGHAGELGASQLILFA
jgi:hypothetical protein